MLLPSDMHAFAALWARATATIDATGKSIVADL
jgi:hypothetical protein